MRSGSLKYPIKFYQLIETKTSSGATTDSYKYFDKAVASILYTSAKESVTNEQVYPSTVVQFTIHYRTDILPSMRIQYDDNWFQILHIEVLGFKRGMKFYCEQIWE